MKVSQGIDIVSVDRIQQSIEKQGSRFIKRTYSAGEHRYCKDKKRKYEHYAARFAAKEAFIKAAKLSKKNSYLVNKIDVRRKATGKPHIYLAPATRKLFKIPAETQIELSLAHERDVAIAVVLMITP